MINDYTSPSQLYKILAHPIRLAILDILRPGEQCVCHMEATLGLRQSLISQHLMVLRDAGLVGDRRDGWNIFYSVCRPEIFAVIDAMQSLLNRPIRVSLIPEACTCPKCNPIPVVGPACCVPQGAPSLSEPAIQTRTPIEKP